jgi:hypothetical protein
VNKRRFSLNVGSEELQLCILYVPVWVPCEVETRVLCALQWYTLHQGPPQGLEQFRGVLKESGVKFFAPRLEAEKIHPLVLGAVHRSREQIGFLASNLMKYHSNDEKHIENIVAILTRERFSHNYIISRREAKKNLGLNIVEPSEEQTGLIVELFNEYDRLLQLGEPYNPETVLGLQESGTVSFNRGIIEALDATHVYRTNKEIRRAEIRQPGVPIPVFGYQERILQEGWILDNEL